jgi:DMSO/TMAO reductase YedYZ heme-binding membrane subunit
MAILCLLCLVVLAVLGFHPTVGNHFPSHSDKVLHFFGFGAATFLFFFCWQIPDESLRRVWFWRHLPRVLTIVVCFGG